MGIQKKCNMKIKLISFFVFFLSIIHVRADEGMWIPLLLEKMNESDMQQMGLKLSAEDIYSINKSSLKDAICLFGGGCTAEVVSEQGLIFTNHHCGHSAIQQHSSLEHNYLEDGFWANSFEEELPNPSLSVTFLIRMEDVTTKVLEGVLPSMTEKERKDIIYNNIEKIEEESVKNTFYKASIKPFYYGNEYYLFITETFNDVRLVGTPPDAIGGFGGDTDNWMWPRHTGDFSVFRIYADKNNQPAAYSKENIPYKPKKSLPISIKGVKENDFTMVYGYPGTTKQYLTSHAVNLAGNIQNPVKINIRNQKLEIMDAAMENDPLIKIQYASKQAGIANAWKKWTGESKGLKKMDAIQVKENLEKKFMEWANTDASRKIKYGKLLETFKSVYTEMTPILLANDYFGEAGASLEMIRYAWGFNNIISKCKDTSITDAEFFKLIEQYKTNASSFFKNIHIPTDKKIFIASMQIYYANVDDVYKPEIFHVIKTKFKGDISKYAEYLYTNSMMVSEEKAKTLLSGLKRNKTKAITEDPFFKLAKSLYENYYVNILPFLSNYNEQLDSLYRIYVTGLREMMPQKNFYPDANLTLRLTYGKVKSYKPQDGVKYNYYTTLEGMMMKEDSTISDYQIPEKLKELYLKKDYGRYASDSTLHVAFIGTNHTSGGNSGSPVLNAEGKLIGLNFDRAWEGTMSDLMYNPDQCRNITLDIRYVLFIIEKYAGATRLIDELNIES